MSGLSSAVTGMNREEINELSNRIIGLALEVHKALGPGFVEKIYQKALAYEFKEAKITFEEQKRLLLRFKVQGFTVQG